MPSFGAGEIAIVLVLLLLLFGAKRLPDTARGLGRSLRIFKAETRGLTGDDTADPQAPPQRSGTIPPTALPPPGPPIDAPLPDESPAGCDTGDPTRPGPGETSGR